MPRRGCTGGSPRHRRLWSRSSSARPAWCVVGPRIDGSVPKGRAKLSPEGYNRMDVIDTPIDFLDMEAVLDRIVYAARQRRFFQIATVNLDFLVQSRRDEEVHAILARSAINIPDGAPIVWAGRRLGLEGIS